MQGAYVQFQKMDSLLEKNILYSDALTVNTHDNITNNKLVALIYKHTQLTSRSVFIMVHPLIPYCIRKDGLPLVLNNVCKNINLFY